MTEAVDGRAGIDARLVESLIAQQFPRWSHLPIRPVPHDGWDNRTYRLGEDMSVRLPTAAGYAPAVAKESRWLPTLAPALPVSVPTILGEGLPGLGYEFPWSVRRWIAGESADRAAIGNPVDFAVAVAEFLRALQRCATTGGPAAGAHSFHRGRPPRVYDGQTRALLATLDGIDTAAATTVWDEALATEWTRSPVWFHGDLAPGNLLLEAGKLTAVIDFGTCGVGDPACDLVPAWTMFSGPSREVFRAAVGHDEDTWARARGWALWKALLTLEACPATDHAERTRILLLVDGILTDRPMR
ncbi:aminoglycoside phosphotransferase family protein [Nocardia sp. NPDC003693]